MFSQNNFLLCMFSLIIMVTTMYIILYCPICGCTFGGSKQVFNLRADKEAEGRDKIICHVSHSPAHNQKNSSHDCQNSWVLDHARNHEFIPWETEWTSDEEEEKPQELQSPHDWKQYGESQWQVPEA